MIRLWHLLCMAALVTGDAAAAESMTRAVLHTNCRAYLELPGSPGALACEAYVQGYLQGLQSEARIESRDRDDAREWTDRAARTRLGQAQLRRLEKPDNYCVPDDAPLAPIIRQLVDLLDAKRHPEDLLASDALAETLRLHYRCEG